MLKYLVENGCFWDDEILVSVEKSGDVETIVFVKRYDKKVK